MTTEKVLAYVDQNLQSSLDKLFDLIRIPSVSTDSAYAKDCRKAGQWLCDYLITLGFTASLRETPGHPIVVAHYKSKSGAARPHVLFYGHYDVQPVDPLNLWNSDPFDPQIVTTKDGVKQIVARGANDDKGQLMTIVEALAAQKNVTGDLPLDVTILFEGEEENGSINLAPFLQQNAAELKCDLALICDTDMWDASTPAITTRLRGLVGEEITVTCADRDLHSGSFGGVAQNPLHALCDVIAKLHDENGRVTLPNFYDDVAELSPEIKKQWDGLNFSEKDFLGDIGLATPYGEAKYSVLEKVWSRPTLEVNGLGGGYTGEGFKTVLPGMAHAKISCRLVSKQNPDKIRASLRKFITDNLPKDCKVEFHAHGGSPGFEVPTEGEHVQLAAAALTAEWDKECVLKGSGGSIPVGQQFKTILGMDSLFIGFGLDDDRIHSPNEKYNLTSFHGGIRSWVRVIDALAKMQVQSQQRVA